MSADAPFQNNCLHEIFFDQALERAKELDQLYAAYKNNGSLNALGLLHGLPVSLKDQLHVRGVDTTMGYVGWIGSNLGIGDPSERHQIESQITKDMLAQGAVLFCKVPSNQDKIAT